MISEIQTLINVLFQTLMFSNFFQTLIKSSYLQNHKNANFDRCNANDWIILFKRIVGFLNKQA